jgi:hypothetical protein
MNELIQQLAVKAKLMAEEDINRQISYNTELKAFAEKFAELLVGECVNMIEAEAENADEEDVHGMRNAAGLISRAFITFHDADLKNNGTF